MMERWKDTLEMDNVTSDQSPFLKKEQKKWKKTQQATPINACHWIYDLVEKWERWMVGGSISLHENSRRKKKYYPMARCFVLSTQAPSSWFLAIKPCVK